MEITLDLYYLAFPDDRVFNKVLVYGVFCLETVQTIILSRVGVEIYALWTTPSYQDPFGWPRPYPEIVIVPPDADTYLLTWISLSVLGGLGTFF